MKLPNMSTRNHNILSIILIKINIFNIKNIIDIYININKINLQKKKYCLYKPKQNNT